jgi:hypothetical protein
LLLPFKEQSLKQNFVFCVLEGVDKWKRGFTLIQILAEAFLACIVRRAKILIVVAYLKVAANQRCEALDPKTSR